MASKSYYQKKKDSVIVNFDSKDAEDYRGSSKVNESFKEESCDIEDIESNEKVFLQFQKK